MTGINRAWEGPSFMSARATCDPRIVEDQTVRVEDTLGTELLTVAARFWQARRAVL
jgi:hypothetical protein